MILARRQFLRCLTGIVAAPAVVKTDALMKVFAPKITTPHLIYSNRVIREYFDVEAMRDRNVILWAEDYAHRIAQTLIYGNPNKTHTFTGLTPLLTVAEHSA
jgi:hypothetical protein